MTRKPPSRSELLAAQELNRRIIEAMPGGIVHVRADGSIQTANAEALRILGLRRDEIAGRYTTDFDTETIWEDGTPCLDEDYPVTRALATGEPQPRATIGIRRSDGEVSWAVFTAVPVKDPDTGATTGAIVTFLDITERKQAEERLLVSDRMASVGTLAAGVAHEINNPLTYVLANLQHLERALDGVHERHRERLARAIEGADRIRDVVRDLSTFSETECEAEKPLRVEQVLESSIRMAHNELRYRARLVRDYGDVPRVLANPSRLGQVFLNLIVNAVQAIPAGDVDGNEVRVSTFTSSDGERVLVRVSDTGSGVPPDVLARIFDPFVTTKPAGIGHGLGLYICHNIVKSIGGRIRVDSHPGSGSIFTVELPAAAAADPSVSTRAVRATDGPRSRSRILVIDDEPAIRAFLVDVLQGHDVELAASGREAIAALDADSFDAVLCDLIMPDLTGMDVFDHVRENLPALEKRIVFMTGAAFTERARELLRQVRNPVLYKPFDVGAVLSAVDPHLQRS